MEVQVLHESESCRSLELIAREFVALCQLTTQPQVSELEVLAELPLALEA